MKKIKRSSTKHRSAIKLAEEELRVGAKILEYEMGDIWGHVGVRLPEDEGIAVQMFRRPESGEKDWLVFFYYQLNNLTGVGGVRLPEDEGIAVQMFRRPESGEKDWLVHFDYQLNKLSGVGAPPREAAIYTGIFKGRPDVKEASHSHAPMCVALSLADKAVSCVQMQSDCFGRGVPIYPKPIYILDDAEGADLARTLDQAVAVMIKGHGIVTVGKTIDEACMCALRMERAAKIM